jgi:uncharacterized membrane protein
MRVAHEIVAIVLDKPSRAEEVLLAVVHLGQEGKVQLHDAVIVRKDGDGKPTVVETTDITPTKGALGGSWLGIFAGLLLGPGGPLIGGVAGAGLGALYGKLVDKGLDDGWVKGMADWIDPDSSALLLLVEDGVAVGVIDELRRFEGTGEVAYTTLPDAVRAELDAALRGEAAAGAPAGGTDPLADVTGGIDGSSGGAPGPN